MVIFVTNETILLPNKPVIMSMSMRRKRNGVSIVQFLMIVFYLDPKRAIN